MEWKYLLFCTSTALAVASWSVFLTRFFRRRGKAKELTREQLLRNLDAAHFASSFSEVLILLVLFYLTDLFDKLGYGIGLLLVVAIFSVELLARLAFRGLDRWQENKPSEATTSI